MPIADSWIRSLSEPVPEWPGIRLEPAACAVVLASVPTSAAAGLVEDWLGRALLRVAEHNMDWVSSFASRAAALVPRPGGAADVRQMNLEIRKMRSGRLVKSAARGCDHARIAARHLRAAGERELSGAVWTAVMWEALRTGASADPQLELFQLVVPELGADGARVAETAVAHMDEPVDDLATVIRALLV